MIRIRHLPICAACAIFLAVPLGSLARQDFKAVISTQEELRQDVTQVPCKESERLNNVKTLFMKLGAQADNLSVEKRDGVENLIIRKAGESAGILVVGAHYDKTRDGCGAVDNWTGIVALAHIYRSLKDHPTKKTLLFVAFGKEEQGLLGSKAMAKSIKKEEVAQYCAMVNIDSLGMAAPQVPENLSSKALVNRVEELARRMEMPFTKINVPFAETDSLSFRDKKIPAVTISALGDGWSEVLHTINDQVSRINPTSVYLGYRLALALVAELDGLPCEASREEKKK